MYFDYINESMKTIEYLQWKVDKANALFKSLDKNSINLENIIDKPSFP